MTGWIVLIIVIIIVVIVVGGTKLSRGGRRRGLREKFGPEYDRVVAEHQSRKLGEAELTRREHRFQKLSLRELTAGHALLPPALRPTAHGRAGGRARRRG